MGKPVRWLKKFFKSSKSPLKQKPSEKGNDKDQVIASKLSNGKQINANVPAQEQVTKELMQAVDAAPRHTFLSAEDQQVMQMIPELKKTNVAATVEPVMSHPLPPAPDIYPTLPKSSNHGNEDVERKAAIKIQTAFRGFLAYRAFRALKGLVRLQAVVRGHQVRRQAALALRCVLAIVKMQAHVRAYQLRMTKGGQEAQKIVYRRPQAVHNRKNEEEKLKRICNKKSNIILANALQRQLDSSVPRYPFSSFQVGEPDSGWRWLQRWTAARPWAVQSVSEKNTSFSHEFKSFKENGDAIDAIFKDSRIFSGSKSRISLNEKTPLPNHPISSFMTPNGSSQLLMSNESYLPPVLSPSGSPAGEVTPFPPCQGSPCSDCHSSDGSVCIYNPLANETITRKSAPLEKERDSASSKNTPRFSNSSKSSSARHESPVLAKVEHISNQTQGSPTMVPSYMATTESSKAKVRSNSTPRNRPDLAEKSPKIYKRRLSLPGSNGKASPETTRSQRWNSNVRPGNLGFSPSLRLDRQASLLRDSSGEVQKSLK